MFDTVDWFTTYLERLEKVTSQDIQRLAQNTLRSQNRTLGVYLPSSVTPP
jgi:predicted Zn-dependent peptidase